MAVGIEKGGQEGPALQIYFFGASREGGGRSALPRPFDPPVFGNQIIRVKLGFHRQDFPAVINSFGHKNASLDFLV